MIQVSLLRLCWPALKVYVIDLEQEVKRAGDGFGDGCFPLLRGVEDYISGEAGEVEGSGVASDGFIVGWASDAGCL